ncbi:hypothetical protein [Sphingomonas melonis]|uniref:hypothetical protein n=1 Tax=Sphingomonas melonis TaxID=152682 RepID=UPI0035C87CD6
MFLAESLQVPTWFRFPIGDVPDELKELAGSIASYCDVIRDACLRFSAAICLYDFAQAQQTLLDDQERNARARGERATSNYTESLWLDWSKLACREGAFALRDFAYALYKIRGLIKKIKSWAEKVDITGLKAWEKKFGLYFPDFHDLRNAVAHPENYADPTRIAYVTLGSAGLPGFIGGKGASGTKLTMQGGVLQGRFTMTHNGRIVSYPVTSDAAYKLHEIALGIISCFESLDPFAWTKR